MSDFERIFGAGADIDGIISDINNSFLGEEEEEEEARWAKIENELPANLGKRMFKTFEEASNWSKNNGSKAFKRSLEGGFIEV